MLDFQFVAKGAAILQAYQLCDKLTQAIKEDDKYLELQNGPFGLVLQNCQECIVLPPLVGLAVRPRPGYWEFLQVNVDELVVTSLTPSKFLEFKEGLQTNGYVVSTSAPISI
ncbi:unnamed protein product [Calypogeia fissa]